MARWRTRSRSQADASRQPRWKRAVALIAFGVAVNFASVIAISLLHWDVPRQHELYVLQSPNHNSVLYVSQYFGYECVEEFRPAHSTIDELLHGSAAAPAYASRTWWTPATAPTLEWVGHIGIGWPAIASRARILRESTTVRINGVNKLSKVRTLQGGFSLDAGSVQSPSSAKIPPVLPYGPVWSGIAINSTLYALALLIVSESISRLKRLVRRRSGKCGHCGYPRAVETSRCPECGCPVSEELI